jgi:hypothetical protein
MKRKADAVIRIDPDIHQRLVDHAAQEGRFIHKVATDIIRAFFVALDQAQESGKTAPTPRRKK